MLIPASLLKCKPTKSMKKIYKLLKEVKKVKIPYFETKVVKVKKEETDFDPEPICIYCGEKIHHKCKKQGNWVNGENLDKIKFPCLCSYTKDGVRNKGILHSKRAIFYELFAINMQYRSDLIAGRQSLQNLIKDYDIHIHKGKIIVFEEKEAI